MLPSGADLPMNVFDNCHFKVWWIAGLFIADNNLLLSCHDADDAADAVCDQLEYEEIFFLACHRADSAHPTVQKAIDLVGQWISAEAPRRMVQNMGGDR